MKKKKKNTNEEVLIHLHVKDETKEFNQEVKNLVKNERKKQLVFSPTGELIVSESTDEITDGSVVIDQIYKDGFFCKN